MTGGYICEGGGGGRGILCSVMVDESEIIAGGAEMNRHPRTPSPRFSSARRTCWYQLNTLIFRQVNRGSRYYGSETRSIVPTPLSHRQQRASRAQAFLCNSNNSKQDNTMQKQHSGVAGTASSRNLV